MKKLRLDVDGLAVESFTAGDVNGQMANAFFTRPGVCDPLTVAPHC
ncbi:MAG TPA: hypothetical protein VFT45_19795 [Longimicrobium sp.]|nr:hypothetical protein [Longimicrobium sp.]